MFNLQDVLIPNSDRPLPDNFHARLGQKLNSERSQVYDQIGKLEKYFIGKTFQKVRKITSKIRETVSKKFVGRENRKVRKIRKFKKILCRK